ncbi:MAG: acetolactate synthase large subunit, partial [Clostridia bacterium]|nr:acetolactate synthase large subunit [Clostridia bacterium]
MNAAQVLVKCLESEGVEYIFGIPGEENLDFMQALKSSSIKFITVRHEQAAAFMADVYGRLTGRAGVCLSTLGPGATNLITGVADANSDGAPLVAITGQVSTDRLHITTHQYLNLTELFEPITKRAKMVIRPDSVSEIVRIAFKYAQSEKPGACLIDLPANIAAMEVTNPSATQPLNHSTKSLEECDIEIIRSAADYINKAKKPVILAGHSAVRNGASSALAAFAKKLHIPVINTMMAKGIVPYTEGYSMWTIGIPQRDYQNKIIEKSDLVIAVGYDIVEFAPSKWNKAGDKKIINIDARPAHINMLFQPETEVIGDISYSLQKLSEICNVKSVSEDIIAIKRDMVNEQALYETDSGYPLKPQRILADLRKVMGEDDIVISDVGAHKMWIARHYNCYKPNTCIISNGFATMGIGVPGAIAAKLINPDKKVLTVTGDGGFMMNCQDIETALRIGANIVILIFNDSSYGLIKWKQDDKFGDHCFVDFTNPDFVKFAESMHCKGYRIESADQLLPTLELAFKQTVPVIIDCPVD